MKVTTEINKILNELETKFAETKDVVYMDAHNDITTHLEAKLNSDTELNKVLIDIARSVDK
jgi:hypothetical protein